MRKIKIDRRRAHPSSHRSLAALAGALLAVAGHAAQAAVLLDENFNDNAAAYSKVLAGEATTSAINIRLANNAINTGTDTGFDSFFGANPNRFLVLGDNAGDLAGEPNGQIPDALAMARFELGAFGAGQHGLAVRFDYAFDTNQNPGVNNNRPSTDDFVVMLLDGSNTPLLELLRFDDVLRNDPSRKGSFVQTVSFSVANPGDVGLAFALFEYNGTASSAVGIDNIVVRAVPEPGSLALLGAGVLALRRRRIRRDRH